MAVIEQSILLVHLGVCHDLHTSMQAQKFEVRQSWGWTRSRRATFALASGLKRNAGAGAC